jgi:cholesterol transport system auxiliary component
MHKIILILSVFLLAACVGNPPRHDEIASYDLGSHSLTWTSPGFPIAAVNVKASSWLESPVQLYRLAYTDDLRRRAYTESRWVAAPAELLERALQQRILFGQPDFSGPGCRLRLALDELEQRFDSPQSSKVLLEVRASLLSPQGDTPLAKRAFKIERPAPSADARGGVVAMRAAAQALADELAQWLGDVARERPQIATACKEK